MKKLKMLLSAIGSLLTAVTAILKIIDYINDLKTPQAEYA